MRLMATLSRLALVGVAVAMAAAASAAGNYQVEFSFQETVPGGAPDSNLLEYQGKLYGTQDYATCPVGGVCVFGGVYDFDPDTGAESVAHRFNNGGWPAGDGLIDFGGELYGTVYNDGPRKDGAIYALDPKTGREQSVYTFTGDANGCHPVGDLIRFGRLLYGMTQGCDDPLTNGTVYAFNPETGVETVVYAFQGAPDGAFPTGDLTVVGGDLYGMTNSGGGSGTCFLGCGTLFKVDPLTGAETVLHSFAGGADGELPNGGLTNVDGLLYGMTNAGGASDNCGGRGCGVIFSLDPATGAETVLYGFKNGSDGDGPQGRLVKVGKSLYGVTKSGGAYDDGTVFAFDLESGAETRVHAFEGGADGATPVAGLTYSHHRLYGTTVGGGPTRGGTVFSIRP